MNYLERGIVLLSNRVDAQKAYSQAKDSEKEFLMLLHNKLVGTHFYQRYIDFLDNKRSLNSVFKPEINKFPYSDCYEGDYKKIWYSINPGGNLEVEYICSFRFPYSKVLALIPLALFDEGADLTSFLNSITDARGREVVTKENEKKEKERENLLKQLKDLTEDGK